MRKLQVSTVVLACLAILVPANGAGSASRGRDILSPWTARGPCDERVCGVAGELRIEGFDLGSASVPPASVAHLLRHGQAAAADLAKVAGLLTLRVAGFSDATPFRPGSWPGGAVPEWCPIEPGLGTNARLAMLRACACAKIVLSAANVGWKRAKLVFDRPSVSQARSAADRACAVTLRVGGHLARQ